MHRDHLPIECLSSWAQLNGVNFNGVRASSLPGDKRWGLLATTDQVAEDAHLLVIPEDLILSQQTVWIYAKSDRYLQQVLEAVGDYSKVN